MIPDGGDRGFGLDDYRSEIHGGDRSGSSMDHLDSARCSPPLPPSSLPHECQVCGKLISCRRNLWKHMERVHLTNPAVKCSICSKLFKNKYALKDHQRIYHGGLSEPLPPSPHHHQSQANLLSRILRDVRPGGLSSGGSPMNPRPTCSIVPVCPPVSMADSRPPRELAPIPHTVSHHSMEVMGSYRRRHLHRDDDELTVVGGGGGSGNSSNHPHRYVDRPPLLPPHTSSSYQASSLPSNSPSGMSSSRRDWTAPQDNSMPSPSSSSASGHHPIFSELHNLSSKSE